MRINDQSIGIGEVVPPQGPQFLLATDIPHSENYILVLNLLNIEADGRDGGENFANVQLIEYGGFSSCIQPKHHHPHLLVAEEGIEELPERLPHLLASGWARCAPDRSLLPPRSNRICEAAAREGAGATRGRGPWREARRPGWKVLEGPDGGRAG